MFKQIFTLFLGVLSLSWLQPASLQAAQSITLMPYTAQLTYVDSTTKDTGSISGIYGFWGMGLSHSLDFALESTSFTSLTGTATAQQNNALVYTYYSSYTSKYRFGTHGVTGDDANTTGGRAMSVGTTYSKYGSFAADLDVYSTTYGDYAVYDSAYSLTGTGLSVTQITPKIAVPFDYGKYVLNAEANIINLSAAPLGSETSYTSATFGLGVYRMRWSTNLDIYAGKEAFAVRDSGFTLYNSSSVYKSGAKLSGAFYYSYQTHYFLSYATRTYEETSADAVANALTLKFKHTF